MATTTLRIVITPENRGRHLLDELRRRRTWRARVTARILAGYISRDEIRRIEGLPPIDR